MVTAASATTGTAGTPGGATTDGGGAGEEGGGEGGGAGVACSSFGISLVTCALLCALATPRGG